MSLRLPFGAGLSRRARRRPARRPSGRPPPARPKTGRVTAFLRMMRVLRAGPAAWLPRPTCRARKPELFGYDRQAVLTGRVLPAALMAPLPNGHPCLWFLADRLGRADRRAAYRKTQSQRTLSRRTGARPAGTPIEFSERAWLFSEKTSRHLGAQRATYVG